MWGIDRRVWTSMVLLRCALVGALIAGLLGMHVMAAAMAEHRASRDTSSVEVGLMEARTDMSAADGMSVADVAYPYTKPLAVSVTTSMDVKPLSVLTSASVAPRQDMNAADTHGPGNDCAPYLGAAIALLVLLIASTARRALRPEFWVESGWIYRCMSITPWRGPPPRRWPRIALRVIRI